MTNNNTTINKIKDIIYLAEKFKNSYFWKSPSTARERREYEEENSAEQVEWTDGKDNYSAEYIVECSAQNIYAKGYYTKNGKKTTLTAIRNSVKRLETAE